MPTERAMGVAAGMVHLEALEAVAVAAVNILPVLDEIFYEEFEGPGGQTCGELGERYKLLLETLRAALAELETKP